MVQEWILICCFYLVQVIEVGLIEVIFYFFDVEVYEFFRFLWEFVCDEVCDLVVCWVADFVIFLGLYDVEFEVGCVFICCFGDVWYESF